MNFSNFLSLSRNSISALPESFEWAEGKTWADVYENSPHGDFLCGVYYNSSDFREDSPLRLITLVKGHQANLVRHLMLDPRSLNAVDTAIAFGEGRATLEELHASAYAAGFCQDSKSEGAYQSAAEAAYYAASADEAGSTAKCIAEAYADQSRALSECADIFRKYVKISDTRFEREVYLGYGCAYAIISGDKLLIDCWETHTTTIISNLYCDALKGVVTETPKTREEEDEVDTYSWKSCVHPNTFFALDIQGQHDVVFFWDGITIFVVAEAWTGGGEACFVATCEGEPWNAALPRKEVKFFKGVKTLSQWAEALKAFKNEKVDN